MKLLTTLAFAGVAFCAPLMADERPDHFEAKPSPTLEAALENLAEYNPRLAALIEKQSLSSEDLNAIHQLTYTLEQALATLGEEKDRVAGLLEDVHLASESADSETVKSSGNGYLEGTAPLID